MDDIVKLAQLIKQNSKIVVFTGAGISCPSGIPDFRSADGLYNEKGYNYSPEQIISHTFFCNHTDLFYSFYKNKMVYVDAKPNIAHLFFAELERNGKEVTVITQNIDGLHQMAGSKNTIELHGSIHRNYCIKCGRSYGLNDILGLNNVPICSCGGIIKPDVVLYEENLNDNDITSAVKALSNADVVIVIGTSLVVYPAASFLRYYNGNHLILINKSETSYDNQAEICFNDDVVNVVNELKKYF